MFVLRHVYGYLYCQRATAIPTFLAVNGSCYGISTPGRASFLPACRLTDRGNAAARPAHHSCIRGCIDPGDREGAQVYENTEERDQDTLAARVGTCLVGIGGTR